jgi:hypothetical protein
MNILLSTCEHRLAETSAENELRRIAWNSLTKNERDTVVHDWREAVVTFGQYEERETAFVAFRTNLDELLGPITVIIDRQGREVVGQFLRD